MIISAIGVSFVGICMGTGGVLTYLGIERKYKLIDKKEAHRILEETFGVIKKEMTEEAATVNNKVVELQEENIQFINLITELKEKNEILEKLVEIEKEKNKKKKVKSEKDVDEAIEEIAENMVKEYGDYIALPTEEDKPTTTKRTKKTKK